MTVRTIDDKKPVPCRSEFGGGFYWYVNGCPVLTAVLPPEVFDRLAGGAPSVLSRRYDSEDEAMDDYRLALVPSVAVEENP